jgi:23S rRNA (guanosine2251-2'-O)-methyltransferase
MQKLFGKKALLDNLDSNNIVEVKLINQDKNIISKLNSKNIKYSIVDKSFFKEFEKELNHQGIITYIKSNSKYSSLEEFLSVEHKKSLILIVDSIEDPYNFGAILRTSDAMGVDAVIYKKDNQVQINDYVIKSSMGAINNINLFKVTNLATCLEKIKASGY